MREMKTRRNKIVVTSWYFIAMCADRILLIMKWMLHIVDDEIKWLLFACHILSSILFLLQPMTPELQFSVIFAIRLVACAPTYIERKRRRSTSRGILFMSLLNRSLELRLFMHQTPIVLTYFCTWIQLNHWEYRSHCSPQVLCVWSVLGKRKKML